jgi:hypothetical protein
VSVPAFPQVIPVERAAFTAYIADRLKEMRPAGMPVQITVPRPLTIKLAAPSGLSVDANLVDLHKHCAALEGRCEEEADKLVESAFQVFGEVTSAVASDMLRIALRSGEWVQALNEAHKLNRTAPVVAKPYVGELWMILAIAGSSFTRYATADTLSKLKLEESAAYELALKNTTGAKAPILERALPLRGTLFHLLAEDELEPSRLLMHSEWAQVAKSRAGALIVSVPASNALIFGHARTNDDLTRMRQIARDASRTAIRSVSPQLFRWRENGWELLDENNDAHAAASK